MKEIIDRYREEFKDSGGPSYGDRKTIETLDNCYDQVQAKIAEGVEEWDGCVGKAKCCRAFTHTLDILKLAKEDEFLGAHFDGEEGEYPLRLEINHKCNKLNESNKCSIYEDRPNTCKEYLCQASKVRRNMFLRIKNPEIAKMVDDESIKEKSK